MRSLGINLPNSSFLTVGVLASELGVSTATLRKWEARYGFPLPMRTAGGARRYDPTTVAKLRLASRRLAGGEKPGVVIRELPVNRWEQKRCEEVNSALEQVLTWFRDGQPSLCEAWLSDELARRNVAAFADDVLGPLLVALGQGWSEARVRVLEEHGLSALVLKVLASVPVRPAVIDSMPGGQSQPAVVLTTLSGEQHALGLAMVKAVLNSHGIRPVNLGASLPLEEIVAAAKCFNADIVALSLSPSMPARLASQSIHRLRKQLPADVHIWLGGSGVSALARIPSGVRVFTSCRDIEIALQGFSVGTPEAGPDPLSHELCGVMPGH